MSGSYGTIRVLHVDDEPDFAEMAAEFLQREDDDLDVQTARSANEGLERLTENGFDCVVSDYDMPEKDGIEFLKVVREEYPDLPFILYTGKGSEEVASDAITAGVTDYLQKASGTSQYTVLANRISNTVNQYRSQQAVRETERKLSELAEQTDDVLFMFNGDWSELLFINSAYENIWGGSIDELEENPTSFLDLIHPADRMKARASMEQLSSGNPSQVEYRVVPPDGEPRWIQGDTKPIQDDDGNVVRIVGLVRDITEQKERELRLQTIIQNLPGYVYRHEFDPEYPLKFVKGDAERVTGYTATELEDQVINAEEIIHPEDRGSLWSNHIEDLETARRFDSTYRIITKDGDVRWIRDQGQLVENPVTGEEVIDGFITDVSENIQREQKLQDQQAFMDESLDALQDVFFAVTRNGELRRWNERVSAVSGYTDEELDGMDATELFVDEDRERISEGIEEVMNTGSSEVQADIVTADGARRAYDFRGTRLTDPVGDEIVAVGIGRDVTEQKQQQAVLERQANRLEAFSIAFPDLAFITDEAGRFRDMIAGERSRNLLIEDPAEFLDKTASDVLPVDVAEEFTSAIRMAIQTDQMQELEYSLELPQGERWFEARIESIPLQIDGTDVAVTVVRDITDRKADQERLAVLTEELEVLNRVIRHDIRNDMNIIMGWADLIEEHVNEEGQDALRKILSSGEHVIELTEIVRDHVKSMTGEGEIETKPVSIRSTIQTEIDLRREAYPDATFHIEGEIPEVAVVANDMLSSVFRNLLNNAVQHNDAEDPVVTVSCTVRDAEVVISVDDNGPGILDDEKESIFGKGEKGLDSPGTGIGLYLVRNLLEQYDGSVWVEDNDPTGAIFKVQLQRAD